MFKKSMSMLLACAMCITMLASCGKKAASEQASKTEPNSVPAQSTSQPEDKPAEKVDATKLVIDKAGDYTAEKGVKDVEIKADGVKLTKSTGLNSVTIGKEVGAGSVTLDGVEAKSILIKGGGKNSIHILGSKFEEAILSQMNALTRIVSDAKSTIGEMQANSPAILEIEGTVKSLIMGKDAKDSTIDVKEGATLTNLMLNALTTVNASANITTVSVYAGAVGCTITVTAGATVATLATETKIELKGKGRIAAAITQSRANLVGNLKAGTVTVNETPVLTTGMPNTAGGTATGTPTVKPITPVTPPVTPPADTAPDEKADKTKLGDMLKVAAKDAAKVGTIWVQAESKYEPKADQHYVTKAQVDAYAEALKAAQAIFDDANATQKQVDDAQTSIANANATFMAAGLNQKGVGTAVSVTSIEIVKAPSKTLYCDNDKLELDGMQCKLTRSDGTTLLVDAKDFAKNNITTVPAQGSTIDAWHNSQLHEYKEKPMDIVTKYSDTQFTCSSKVQVCQDSAKHIYSQAELESTLNDDSIACVVLEKDPKAKDEYEVPNGLKCKDKWVFTNSHCIKEFYRLGTAESATTPNKVIADKGSVLRWKDKKGYKFNIIVGRKGTSDATIQVLDEQTRVEITLNGDKKVSEIAILGNALICSYLSTDTPEGFKLDGTNLKVQGKVSVLNPSDWSNVCGSPGQDPNANITDPKKKVPTINLVNNAKIIIEEDSELELQEGALIIAEQGDKNFEINGTLTNNAGVCDNTTVKGLVGIVTTNLTPVTIVPKPAQKPLVFSSKNTATYGDAALTLAAAGGEVAIEKPVTYAITTDTNKIATLNGDKLTFSGIGSVTITAIKRGNKNFADVTETQVITVAPKALTVTGAKATDRVYDDTADVVLTNGKLEGVVANDAENVIALEANPKGVADSYIGKDLPVTTKYKLTGTGVANYVLTQPKGITVTISKAAAKATLTSAVTSAQGAAESTTKLVGLTGATRYDFILNNSATLIAADSELWKTAGLETGTVLMTEAVQTTTHIHIREHANLKYYMPAADFAIELAYKSIPSYAITVPGTKTINGVTATLTGAATAQRGSKVDLTLTLTGTPDATGYLVMNVTSAKAGAITTKGAQFIKITKSTAIAADTKYVYTMTMPNEAVSDLAIALTYQDKMPQKSLVFSSVDTVTYGDATLTLVAAGGEAAIADAVTYAITPSSIATLNGDKLTFSGAGSVTITATKKGNTEFTDVTQTQVITAVPKALTITGAKAADRAYDGTTKVALTNGKLEGVLNADDVTLDTPTGTAIGKDVATGVTVTSHYTLKGAKKANYTIIDQPTDVKVNIAKAPLTITSPAATPRKYDGTMVVALTGTLTGMVNGEAADVITLAADPKGIVTKVIGADLAVTTDYKLTGSGKGNYELTQPTSVKVTISKKAAVAKLSGITSVEGTAAATTKLVGANLKDTTYYQYFITSDSYCIDANHGMWNQTNTVTGAELKKDFLVEQATPYIHIREKVESTYQDAGEGVSIALTVKAKANQAPLFITPFTATYGDTVKTLATTGGTGVDDVRYDITSGNEFATVLNNKLTIVGAGNITITATKIGYTGYNDVTATLNVAIAAKELTVTGTKATDRAYDGTTNVVLTNGKLEGILNSDAVTLATLTGTVEAKDVTTTAAAVTTKYSLTGDKAANYTVKQPSGVTVNITRAPVTITGVTATKTYDGTTAVTLTGTPALDGVIAADKATATLKAGYPTAGTVTSADWTGKPVDVAIGTYALEGAGASNYALTQPTVQVTIAKATLTVPTDTTKPTASEIAKVNDKLSTSIITGTKALCGETVVEGAWAWKDGTIIVDKSGLQTAVFTPTSTNYAPLEAQIQVDVTKTP